jgi:hypothetical protein
MAPFEERIGNSVPGKSVAVQNEDEIRLLGALTTDRNHCITGPEHDLE